jgi:hypothetical protein
MVALAAALTFSAMHGGRAIHKDLFDGLLHGHSRSKRKAETKERNRERDRKAKAAARRRKK